MMHNPEARPGLKRMLSCSALALAIAGCQHSHIATTQVVVNLGNNQTAVVEEVAPEPAVSPATPSVIPPTVTPPVVSTPVAAAPMTSAPSESAPATTAPAANASGAEASVPSTDQATTQEAATQESSGVTSKAAAMSSSAGHGVAEASRQTGHAVAEASRDMGHGVAEASRNTYAAVADGTHEFRSSVVDISTNSITRIRNSPPESLTAPVIDIDEAMQLRDWDRATATYSSGGTVAGPIGFLYAPRPGQSAWRYQILDIPVFLGNVALMPLDFAQTPPWKPLYWKAATVEPSYTAVPPLPPE